MNRIKMQMNQPHHVIFGVFFALYILLDVETPLAIAQQIDTVYGKLFLGVLAVIIFFQTNPIVGVLAIIAIYELIKRSTVATGRFALKHYMPSEAMKLRDFNKYNDFKVTLEEQVVASMAPLVRHDAPANIDYKPVLDAQYDAAPIDYQGVI